MHITLLQTCVNKTEGCCLFIGDPGWNRQPHMQLELCKTELCCLRTADYIPFAFAPWQSGHALQQCPHHQLAQQEKERLAQQGQLAEQGHQCQRGWKPAELLIQLAEDKPAHLGKLKPTIMAACLEACACKTSD